MPQAEDAWFNGSRASVVMALRSGVLIFTMEETDNDDDAIEIAGDCTVGVFVARIFSEDGP